MRNIAKKHVKKVDYGPFAKKMVVVAANDINPTLNSSKDRF